MLLRSFVGLKNFVWGSSQSWKFFSDGTLKLKATTSFGILQINLCQGEGSVLASAELMYEDLFPSELTEISAPLVIEREIALHPVPDNRFQIPDDGQFLEGATPVLGVACEISILQRVGM